MATEPTDAPGALGLRERKKLETRQRISDVATVMFLEEGFETVRVADIATRVGVSEKTIYNYFPTKESLVFDQFDAQLAESLAAVTSRAPGTSPVRAYVDDMKRQLAAMADDDAAEEFARVRGMIPRFGAMLSAAPTLRAAWGDHRDRMVNAVCRALAEDLGVGELDPEPRTAARALVSLTELSYDSMMRNIAGAESWPDLQRMMGEDLERGARLLDTGMWSLALMIGGRRTAEQIRETAREAERLGRQVMLSVRQARHARREHG